MLIKFAEDTKLDGTLNMHEGGIVMLRYPNRWEEWADRNSMKFTGHANSWKGITLCNDTG